MNSTTMLLANGQLIDLARPSRAAVPDIGTLAHHLAQINRFTGAARRPYSVAEHSLLVADIAERELRMTVHGQLAALLHDAHEALTSDASTPAKAAIGPAWGQFEHPWQRALQCAYAIVTPSAALRGAIKRADLMALAIERRDLMPGGQDGPDWPVLAGVEVLDYISVNRPPNMFTFKWSDWRDAFRDKFDELDFARNLLMGLKA